MALIDEKQGKGYELRPWPTYLHLPDGTTVEDDPSADDSQTRFRAATRGTLPPETGGTIAGVGCLTGRSTRRSPRAGPAATDPSSGPPSAPVKDVASLWSRLAAAFPETGVWPFVIDASYGFEGFDERLMDVPRGRHTEVLTILRRGWSESVDRRRGVRRRGAVPVRHGVSRPRRPDASGRRPHRSTPSCRHSSGHLGLVAVNRPADILDAVGWMGAANYDGDPLDMTTVLRSWELRFDAYVVGLGTDTLTVAVGRPARDLASATAIAAEHYAFCPDNIQQGVGTIREYAEALVDAELWPFWWD